MLNRDYLKQHLELQPSIFRQSENLGLLFESIYDVLMTQQDDFSEKSFRFNWESSRSK